MAKKKAMPPKPKQKMPPIKKPVPKTPMGQVKPPPVAPFKPKKKPKPKTY